MLKFWNGLKGRLREIIFHWHIELVIRSGKNILYWKPNDREMKPSVPTFSQDNNISCPYLYLYGGDAGGDCVPPFSGHR